MNEKYRVYLVSDSTGETIERIFTSLKSQFKNFKYEKREFVFIRTEQQIDKIIEECSQKENSIVLYTIVETKLAKYISNETRKKDIPCFGILGNLILSFSKLLNQKASHKPSAQHVLDKDYYRRIEAIQFTMSHDDGNKVGDIDQSDIVLLGVSRTSKTPPLIQNTDIPSQLKKNFLSQCVVGLYAAPERLYDIRRNRLSVMNEKIENYTDLNFIKMEVDDSRTLFKKYNWPTIDVTRKSVEETAASIIKIYEINRRKKK